MNKISLVWFLCISITALLPLAGCSSVSLTLTYDQEQAVQEIISGTDTGRLARDLEILGKPRFPYYRYTDTPSSLQQSLQTAEGYIIGVYQGLGYTVESRTVGNTAGSDNLTAKMNNIVATKPGLCSEAAPVVIGAHWDTVYGTDGADDNASGTAALLEIARLFAGQEFQRDIVFAHFAFEETGFTGSRVFVQGLDRTPAAVFNLDCIGYTTSEANRPTGSFLFGFPETGNYIAYYGNPMSGDLTREYAEISRRFVPELPIVVISRAYDIGLFADIYYSDHRSFWEADIPAVFVTNNPLMRSPAIMHTADDRTEKLDLDFLAQNIRACAANAYVAAAAE